MNFKLIASFLLCSSSAIAQKDIELAITTDIIEGRELACLEVTRCNAYQIYRGIDNKDPSLAAFFPIHEDGKYKCIYWRADPVPEIYATVTFEDVFDLSSAQVDTAVRQFNELEAAAFRLYDMAYFDFLYFHTGGMLPKTYVSIIPMITERGRKVYVNFRSDSENRCLFGNDVEYSFGENFQMIARIKAHKNSTEFWATGKGGENQYYGPWFHNHQMDKLEGISVADIATIYLYNARFRWKRFLFKDSRYIYEFQPDKPSLHRYTHAQFDVLNSTTTN